VKCDTVRCNPGVARSRLFNAAFRLGVKITTRQEYDPKTRSCSIVGTVKITPQEPSSHK
jgi:hypothetical protein|tara:strand:+ start:509 stop:685 length:177 start_codon:yes stop_codon:yes gene_type:complete